MLWTEVPWRERWGRVLDLAQALDDSGSAGTVRPGAMEATACSGLRRGVRRRRCWPRSPSFAVTGRLPTGVEDVAGSLLRNHSAQSMAFAVAALLALWLAADRTHASLALWLRPCLLRSFVLNMAFVTPRVAVACWRFRLCCWCLPRSTSATGAMPSLRRCSQCCWPAQWLCRRWRATVSHWR